MKAKTRKLFLNCLVCVAFVLAGGSPGHCKLSPSSPPSELRAYIESVEKSSNPTAEELLQQANASWWLKDYKSAINSINKILVLRPDNGVAYAFRAVMFKLDNKFPESLSDFNKAEQLGYKRPNLFADRGRVKLVLGDFQGAQADVHRAIKLEPNDPENYGLLGAVEIQLANYNAAIENFTKAILMSPQDGAAFAGRAAAYKALNRRKEAELDLSKAYSLGWKSPVTE
jgi:Flp pilus assembly protein TadD